MRESSRHQLIPIETTKRQLSIQSKAKELEHETILTKISGYRDAPMDLIAAGFCYHKSCMSRFMNRRKSNPRNFSSSSHAYENAFLDLVAQISQPLINDRKAFYITQLRDLYRNLLGSHGIENPFTYRSTSLQQRLKSHFGSSIQIIPQRGRASIVVSSEITASEMCDLISKLQSELDQSQLVVESDASEDENSNIVASSSESFMVAKRLRSEIKDEKKKHSTEMGTSPDAFIISYEEALERTPMLLYNFYCVDCHRL